MAASPPTNSPTPSRQKDFADSLATFSSRIEWRLADTCEERQAIFRLRYQAYLRNGMISPNPFEKFTDAADGAENAYLFSVYIDNQVASSLRVHIGSRGHPNVPSLEIFSDALQPLLRAGRVIVDCTHLVADERLARLYPALPYISFRPCMLAAEYFHGDDLLAAVRIEHQAFYRRAFNCQVLCGPRQHPQLTKPLSLLTLHYPTATKQLCEKYPFLCSSAFERHRIFASTAICAATASRRL
jgi:hypothetical protein